MIDDVQVWEGDGVDRKPTQPRPHLGSGPVIVRWECWSGSAKILAAPYLLRIDLEPSSTPPNDLTGWKVDGAAVWTDDAREAIRFPDKYSAMKYCELAWEGDGVEELRFETPPG